MGYAAGVVMRSGPDASSVADRARGTVLLFVALAGVACSITLLFLGMRAVMAIGGFCASGGPYVIAHRCPHGVPGIMVGSVAAGLVFGLAYAAIAASRTVPSLAGFIWPALFLSLGWNFLEFGLRPPGGGGVVWGWIVDAVLFALLGGVPLLIILAMFWRRPRAAAAAAGPAAGDPATISSYRAIATALRRRSSRRGTAAGVSAGGSASGEDVVSRLERLDAPHRGGGLTDDEYEAAKRAVLEET